MWSDVIVKFVFNFTEVLHAQQPTMAAPMREI